MDFCAELLRISRQAVHIFMDEADTFAPQTPRSVLANKCLGTVSRLVKQGGIRGVGFTMITQRSASINWDILSQIVHQRIEAMLDGPQTKIFRIAVKAYPRAVAKDYVMAEAGYGNASSKGFANSVSRLRSLGFIDYPTRGEIVATAQCFLPRS